MLELFHQAILPINLPLTVLFGLIMLYWLSVIFGALDISLFDVDLDLDADADVDVDIDADMDVDAGAGADAAGPGVFHSFLAFLNLGDVPLMLVLSIIIISMWSISILSNFYLNNTSAVVALGLLIPNGIFSIFLSKFITSPIKSFLRRTRHKPAKAIGSLCTLGADANDSKLTEAIVETGGASLILNVRTRDGQTLPKGSQALVIEKDTRDPDKDIYIVEPFDEWER